MRASSRPELFFIYGLIVSVLVIVIFFGKIEQLSSMDDIIAEYYANDLSLVVDVSSARSGYMRIPFTIARLSDPNVTIKGGHLNLSYVSGEHNVVFSEARRVLPEGDGSVKSDSGVFVTTDHAVEVRETEQCIDEARTNRTLGSPLEADFVTVIVSDPRYGCVELERIARGREGIVDPEGFSNVQRVIVSRALDAEVVIFAR